MKKLFGIVFLLLVISPVVLAEYQSDDDYFSSFSSGNNNDENVQQQAPTPQQQNVDARQAWCTYQYNVAKGQYLTKKEQIAVLKRRSERMTGKALLSTAVSLVARNNTNDQFWRDIWGTTAIVGGFFALAGTGETHYYRKEGNNILPPRAPKQCRDLWDMNNFENKSSCILEEMISYDYNHQTSKVRTFICGNNATERGHVYAFLQQHGLYRQKDLDCVNCN